MTYWASESRRASRSRTANKGVVLSCRGIRKPLGHPKQLRTRGLFCPAGVSESRWATRSRTANKGVVLM
uniref:hypothetical protein n=1 Tax=Klebsiella pneumoniae TaxID=573 RepID=UPI00155D94F0|nr:hypothetical protein [Klebsiella pneumoniae]